MVVVKVLTAVDAEATRRRFDRERRAMGRLSQAPGIAPLYDSGFTPAGQPWLLMPYYERGSLQQVLDTQGPLPSERVRDIGVRISRAVHAAHENGVFHRDLKPANILVSRSGQPDVADFGIAHLVDESGGMSQALTMTPLYTAPEIFDGVDSGAASDVYSLGALLYALLNGRPAFLKDATGGAPMLALMRRINEEPVPALPAEVPASLAAVIARSMSKDPNARQPSAAAFADELAALNLTAPPAQVAPPAPAAKGRTGTLVAAAIVVLILAVAGALGATMLLNDDASDDVADPDRGVTPVVTVTPTPTPVDAGPVVVTAAFDSVAAASAGATSVVRVEAFSCTGAESAIGVVLDDGRVLTDAEILRSPWYVTVTLDGQSVTARPLTMDLNRSLALLTPDADTFQASTIADVAVDDQVMLYEGSTFTADAVVVALDSGRLIADLPLAIGAQIDHGTPAFSGDGDLVAIAIEGDEQVGLMPIVDFETGWNRTPPRRSCPSLVRDLHGDDAGQARSAEIAELLYLQRLSDALAAEDWSAVREYEPGKATLTDADFIAGWRPLRQGFIYPVERTGLPDGTASWRLGLIGHETWDGSDLSTLFCVTWEVDGSTGQVVQTNQDTVRVYGSQPGQPQRAGFVDPADMIVLIDANCPL